jgi:probable FeS assembly SUF system protein SufT
MIMNSDNKTVVLTRDVNATLVPFGETITLPTGTEVIITQSLGGTYTVIANDQMLRITGDYADALGQQVISLEEKIAQYTDGRVLTIEEKVWLQLSTCYDPEIPVNIVDLGLVYQVEITPTSQQKYDVLVKMTLTAPGCGMGPFIAAEAKQKILTIPEVNEATIEIIFDPPWDRSRMSEQAKLELGLF